ncbi:hypothetical protein AB835_03130 [Candidatus Endobugula sertula]|uniref:Uncharacterized protein n=1 Tax=Candidatus Endobugula sertula TaxID=62101 RepID=A0A1D2QSP0_9GAMM|nr:hypothetical protein AB835_03130 [Candidatus Endobugula sertula]
MLGMVVFQSREFKSEKSSKFVKLILYIINSLIIFSMATGTTSVMAEDMINQERPLFYDWTKSSADLQHRDSETSDSNYEIKVEITKSQKPGLKSWLQNQGVITKSYETKLSLVTKNEDPDAQPKNIKFFLPKNEFKVDKISLTPRQVKQGINIKAWKSFPVEAEITTETGKNIKIYKYVNPEKIIKGSQ